MKRLRLYYFLPVLFVCTCLHAQYIKIYGQIINDSAHSTLPGVGVILYTLDSSKQYTAVTDIDGKFAFQYVTPSKYKLRATYTGFNDLVMNIPYSAKDMNLGMLNMQWGLTMQAAIIQGKIIPVQQKEDTTEFNADAFKTHPDASSEDLVNKMPGVSSQNGSVTVNGEQVTQILVDGEPFFGNDPAIALKNLPAEVVDKIQVFDKLSDQAQFTGFDDGSSQKTINIVTKKNKRNGTFGKGYVGYGTDERYLAGGNLNMFDGTSRFSILGIADNVNQQNFATQDILGAISGGGGGRGSGGGGGGGMGGGGYSQGANNFLVGTQNGITTTNSVGLNYTNAWNKNKVKLTASYFFNNSMNVDSNVSTTAYTGGPQNTQILNQLNKSNNTNYNNRFNGRFQWNVDSINSIIATITGSTQNTSAASSFFESDMLEEMVQSFSQTMSSSSNVGYNFNGNVLMMHKFKKKGRTISLNLGGGANNKNAPGSLYALSGFIADTTLQNQQITQKTTGYNLTSNLSYTEPLDSNSLLQFNYTPSMTVTNTNKQTFNYDSLTNTFNSLDTGLSNQYQSTYITQVGGISYRLNKNKKFFLMASVNGQYATLSSNEELPENISVLKPYENILPRLVINYRFSKTKNLRIMYKTAVTPPSITQLQNVVNNSNPLLLSTGNPSLRQDYEQSFTARYGATNSGKRTTFLIYLFGNYIQHYLGNATYIPLKDTVFGGNTLVQKGAQILQPVNLNSYLNSKAFVTYGWLIHVIKCNLNLNSGITYTRTPSLINNEENFSSNYTLSNGVVISSDISEKIDFTLGYTNNYSMVQNTIQNQADDDYTSQVISGKVNFIILKGIVLNSTVTYTVYNGLGEAYNQGIWLWVGSVGYKFLKQQALLVSVSAFDLLNQNRSISRSVTDTYIQDTQTQVLQRYYMVNVQYTIRKFKKPPTPATS